MCEKWKSTSSGGKAHVWKLTTHKLEGWKFIDDISDLTIFFTLFEMIDMLQQNPNSQDWFQSWQTLKEQKSNYSGAGITINIAAAL